MNPLGTRMKSSHGVLLVLAIWLVSGLLSLPYAIYHKVHTQIISPTNIKVTFRNVVKSMRK